VDVSTFTGLELASRPLSPWLIYPPTGTSFFYKSPGLGAPISLFLPHNAYWTGIFCHHSCFPPRFYAFLSIKMVLFPRPFLMFYFLLFTASVGPPRTFVYGGTLSPPSIFLADRFFFFRQCSLPLFSSQANFPHFVPPIDRTPSLRFRTFMDFQLFCHHSYFPLASVWQLSM